MTVVGTRMTAGTRPPGVKNVSAWIGSQNHQRWTRLLQYIERSYAGVFVPEWLFGGKKHGWGLRFKKSKSFCTLIPERNRMSVLIVFGGPEREKAEAVLRHLTPGVRRSYRKAKTYHDGKWLSLIVDHDEIVEDIQTLLAIKRRIVDRNEHGGNIPGPHANIPRSRSTLRRVTPSGLGVRRHMHGRRSLRER